MKNAKNFAKTMVAGSFLACSLNSFAYVPDNAYKVPAGYTAIDSALGVTLFANSSKDVFVQVSDLNQVYFANSYKKSSGNSFYLKKAKSWLGRYDFSVINGAFFNMINKPTAISFPFTPGGNFWGDLDNTRTLCVKGRKATVEHTGRVKADYSRICDFSVTLLNPDVDKGKTYYRGRTYIGLPDINQQSSISSRYVIFIVAKKKTQYQMEDIARDWNIQKVRLIMGDGSASSQYVGHHQKLYGVDRGGDPYRDIPHGIVTKLRGFII